jgi:hypothetical protein
MTNGWSKHYKRPANNGASWSAGELRTLKQLAKAGTAQSAAKKLGRTPAAVQQKAAIRLILDGALVRASDAVVQIPTVSSQFAVVSSIKRAANQSVG